MTDSARSRLVRCFSAVFPEVSEQAIPEATPDNVARWDSTNQIILIQVVEEEFAVTIPESAADELLGFRNFENYLSSRILEA